MASATTLTLPPVQPCRARQLPPSRPCGCGRTGTGTPNGSVFLDGITSLSVSLSMARQPLPRLACLWLALHHRGLSGKAALLREPRRRWGQIVNKQPLRPRLSTSAGTAVSGQAVTFNAIVTAVAPGAGTPDGSLTFMDGSTTLGSGTLANGQATFTISTLAVGTHSITAVYQGSTSYVSSSASALGQIINPAATTTTLTSSANTTVSGQSVTFTAIVTAVASGSGTPSGSVTFMDGPLRWVAATLANGQATLAISTLTVGTHITTVYGGAPASEQHLFSCKSGSGPTTPYTNTVVVSSVDPVVAGQPVTFTVAVAPAVSSLVLPTGTVTFSIDGVAQPAVALANGLATLAVPTMSVGSHTVVGVYSGDASFGASTSATFTEVSSSTYVAPWQAPGLNVTKYGVVGDGVTDNTLALQNLINRSAQGTLFYFPSGTYVIAGTVSFAGLQSFGIEGDTTAAGLPASMIKGTATTGNVVSVDYGRFQIKNMQFARTQAKLLFTSNAAKRVL